MSFLSSSVSRIVDRVTPLMTDEVAAHGARLTGVVTSAFDSLELDLWSIVELLHTAEQGFSV